MLQWIVGCLVVVGSSALAQPISKSDHRTAQSPAGTRASLSPDGPWLPVRAKTGEVVSIHDDTDARPQFVEYAPGVELLLYAERSTLGDVALDGAALYPNVAAAQAPLDDRRPGMALEPGTLLGNATPAANGLVKVKVHVDGRWNSIDELQIIGYVPSSHIGKVYTVKHAARPELIPDVILPIDFQLRDAPNGAVFAISRNSRHIKAKTLRRDKQFTLVRIQEGAVGWIASSQTKPLSASNDPDIDIGDGTGVEGGVEDEVKETLPIDTPLFDAAGGRVVGAIIQGFRYHPAKQDHDWLRFDVKTRFGDVELWARPGATATGSVRPGGSPSPTNSQPMPKP